MIRLLALTLVIATPCAALAEPTAAMLTSSILSSASSAARQAPAPVQRLQLPTRAAFAGPRRAEAPRFEYRPARDYDAPPEGLAMRGTKIGFFKSF